MPDAARAADRDRRALDDISEQLGTVLRTADDLLADWSRFGAQVRAQVERDAESIGDAVAAAAERAAAGGIDRILAERLGALSTELGRLEQRARAAARAQAEQRSGDRKLLIGGLAGIALANVLLVLMLLRGGSSSAAAPEPLPTPAPAVSPTGDGSGALTAPSGDGANGANHANGAGATTDPSAAAEAARDDGAMPTGVVTNAVRGAAGGASTGAAGGAAPDGAAAAPDGDARPAGAHPHPGGAVHQGVPVHHAGR